MQLKHTVTSHQHLSLAPLQSTLTYCLISCSSSFRQAHHFDHNNECIILSIKLLPASYTPYPSALMLVNIINNYVIYTAVIVKSINLSLLSQSIWLLMQRQQEICLCTSCQDIKESVDILIMSRPQIFYSYIYKTVSAAGMFILFKRKPISSCTVYSCPTKLLLLPATNISIKQSYIIIVLFPDYVFYSVHSSSWQQNKGFASSYGFHHYHYSVHHQIIEWYHSL